MEMLFPLDVYVFRDGSLRRGWITLVRIMAMDAALAIGNGSAVQAVTAVLSVRWRITHETC
jgi:hypothetical protein